MTFPKAEVVCLPHPDDPYEKRLAWTENLEHWDFMSFLAKGRFFSVNEQKLTATQLCKSWLSLAKTPSSSEFSLA